MKVVFQMLLFFGRISGWRWLMLVAGMALLTGTQSCRSGVKTCYSAMPVDTNKVIEPTCYVYVPLDDSVEMVQPPTDSTKKE